MGQHRTHTSYILIDKIRKIKLPNLVLPLRNSLLLAYPHHSIFVNLFNRTTDNFPFGFTNCSLFRNMIDTTFEISTQNSFVYCARLSIETKSYYDYGLFEKDEFPKHNLVLFRSNVYFDCDYNTERNELLFTPYIFNEKQNVLIHFKTSNSELFNSNNFILIYNLETLKYKILTFIHNRDSAFRFIFGPSGNIYGYSYYEKYIKVFKYSIVNDRLLIIKSYMCKVNIKNAHMKHLYYPYKAEIYHNFFILYCMDSITKSYNILRFNIYSSKPQLIKIYSSTGLIGHIGGTDLFLNQDIAEKKFQIFQSFNFNTVKFLRK